MSKKEHWVLCLPFADHQKLSTMNMYNITYQLNTESGLGLFNRIILADCEINARFVFEHLPAYREATITDVSLYENL